MKFENILIFFLFVLFQSNSKIIYAQTNHFPKSRINLKGNFPSIEINDSIYPAIAYMSYLGKPQYYRDMASQGLHIYNIPAYLGDRGINSTSGIKPFRAAIWKGKNKYDYSSVIADFDSLLISDSNGKAVIRIHLDPPQWWEIENPGNSSMQPDGSSYRFSLFSLKWREDAGEALRSFITWLNNSKYAEHVIGIHIAAGFTEEWFYHYKDHFYDLNPVRLSRFRAWLKQKYKSNEKLRKAWGNNQITFEDAELADISGSNPQDRWLDLSIEQNFFDTFCFQSENMVQHIRYFADIVKKESEGRLLTGVFYGYHNFVTDPRRGHGSLYKVLQLPNIDYISSPNDYNRVIGEDWPAMVAIQSIQKHGKLWMAENDTRTSLTTLLKDEAPEIDPGPAYYRDGVWLGPKDLETSESFLWKNLARMLANGYGGWWFDMWGGWFSDAQLLQVIKKGQELGLSNKTGSGLNFPRELAVIVDEKLAFRDASYGRLTSQFYLNRYALGKTGIPYDQYLREDFDYSAFKKYKAIWLLGNFELSSKEWNIIRKLKNQGVMLIITDHHGSVISTKNKEEQVLTGKIQWNENELSKLLKEQSIHQYLDAGDVLYSGNGWISLHSAKTGDKTIILPIKSKVIDVIGNEEIGVKDMKFQVNVKAGETKIWKVIKY